MEFLRIHGDERWFLYLHLMDLHQYLYDEESALFGGSYSDNYDNSIRWTDAAIEARRRARLQAAEFEAQPLQRRRQRPGRLLAPSAPSRSCAPSPSSSLTTGTATSTWRRCSLAQGMWRPRPTTTREP